MEYQHRANRVITIVGWPRGTKNAHISNAKFRQTFRFENVTMTELHNQAFAEAKKIRKSYQFTWIHPEAKDLV